MPEEGPASTPVPIATKCVSLINDPDEDGAYWNGNDLGSAHSGAADVVMSGPMSSSMTWTVRLSMRYFFRSADDGQSRGNGRAPDGLSFTSAPFNLATLTSGWADYDLVCNIPGATGLSRINEAGCQYSTSATGTGYFSITRLRTFATTSTASTSATRLIPSGPIPRTWPGYLTKGSPVTGTAAAETVQPNADRTDNTWLSNTATNVDLYSYVDDTKLSRTTSTRPRTTANA